ncbi:MAG: MBL fold metallo-hydrolase [Acetobacterales bacterium]
MSTTLRLLGTGNPVPSSSRVGSSYLVETNGQTLLFDHGHGSHQRLLDSGGSAAGVDVLFLTHLHYDHCCDVPRLMLSRWDQADHRVPALRVFGPPGTRTFLARLFGPQGAFSPDLRARINHPMSVEIFKGRGGEGSRRWLTCDVTEIGAGDRVAEGDWSVTVAEVPHAQPYLTCLACRLETPDGVLVYSGDSGPCESMRELARGADVLLHMCANISGEEAAPMSGASAMPHKALAWLAQDCGVKTLVPTHINPGMERRRDELMADMAAIYGGRLVWAEDLLEVTVGG